VGGAIADSMAAFIGNSSSDRGMGIAIASSTAISVGKNASAKSTATAIASSSTNIIAKRFVQIKSVAQAIANSLGNFINPQAVANANAISESRVIATGIHAIKAISVAGSGAFAVNPQGVISATGNSTAIAVGIAAKRVVATADGYSLCCAGGTKKMLVTYDYAEGSIVYDIKKAKKGILLAIAIKKVNIVGNIDGKITIMYTDTDNHLWNQYDLCSRQEARDLAINYLERKQAEIWNAMVNCEKK
jgi:hypothetical protein